MAVRYEQELAPDAFGQAGLALRASRLHIVVERASMGLRMFYKIPGDKESGPSVRFSVWRRTKFGGVSTSGFWVRTPLRNVSLFWRFNRGGATSVFALGALLWMVVMTLVAVVYFLGLVLAGVALGIWHVGKWALSPLRRPRHSIPGAPHTLDVPSVQTKQRQLVPPKLDGSNA